VGQNLGCHVKESAWLAVFENEVLRKINISIQEI
jgi:hypothetical protein